MADTLKRLFGPVQLGNASAVLYTVPAGTTAVVRTMRVCNTNGTDRTLTLAIGADAAGTRLFAQQNVPGNGSLDWASAIVLNAGETLTGYASASGSLTTTICGVEVTP